MNPICFYHKSDLDGICSAAIVKHFIPDCELYGIDHGDVFPWDKVENSYSSRKVYMVDFSLPVYNMERLNNISRLTWIDHHKTAIDSLSETHILGLQSIKYSGCELTWIAFHAPCLLTDTESVINNFFNNKYAINKIVQLLGRYDIWDKTNIKLWNDKIVPFQYGIRSDKDIFDPCSKLWTTLLFDSHTKTSKYVKDGNNILSYLKSQNQKIAQDGAFEYCLFPNGGPYKQEDIYLNTGWQCICLNTPLFSSQSFDSVYDESKYDIMMPFAKLKNGKWKVSLYSTHEYVDCGLIAKKYGGGGHKGAAGFICDKLPWD